MHAIRIANFGRSRASEAGTKGRADGLHRPRRHEQGHRGRHAAQGETTPKTTRPSRKVLRRRRHRGRIAEFFTGTQRRYAAQIPGLTGREREVLNLVATGCRNHEIARRWVLSENTVRNHVATILTKLQAPNRAAAVAKARDAAIGPAATVQR